MFREMLNEMRMIEASGFNPAEETYSARLSKPINIKQDTIKAGIDHSSLTPKQQRAVKSLVSQSNEDVGGQTIVYRKTSDGKFVLDEQEIKTLLDAMDKRYPPNVDKGFVNSIEKRGDEYVTPMRGNSSNLGKSVSTYYEQDFANYDPVSGETMSTAPEREVSDFLIKQAVKRGDGKVKSLIRETPEEDFKKRGISKEAVMKRLGIQ
jgi:hypothetical protein